MTLLSRTVFRRNPEKLSITITYRNVVNLINFLFALIETSSFSRPAITNCVSSLSSKLIDIERHRPLDIFRRKKKKNNKVTGMRNNLINPFEQFIGNRMKIIFEMQ